LPIRPETKTLFSKWSPVFRIANQRPDEPFAIQTLIPPASDSAGGGPDLVVLEGVTVHDGRVEFRQRLEEGVDPGRIRAERVLGEDGWVRTVTLEAVDADDATTQERTLTVQAGTGTATLGGNVGSTGAMMQYGRSSSAPYYLMLTECAMGDNVAAAKQVARLVRASGSLVPLSLHGDRSFGGHVVLVHGVEVFQDRWELIVYDSNYEPRKGRARSQRVQIKEDGSMRFLNENGTITNTYHSYGYTRMTVLDFDDASTLGTARKEFLRKIRIES